ncbi:hypothetical protein OJAV_G00078420 [Oryzias javanicus]|uniref:Uncharacterized protein n=1 Tax=Oryzias javanicus TaxID=123683 RepID=A0A437D341_ORYJA|nr:hypothetical protein OJAV_G00078420 [Oryzias javanicus]
MAFGVTLWVSWISLLFRCTCVSAGNGVAYRPTHAATNLMDDGHEDRFHTLSFDEGNLDEEASTNRPTSAFHASFNKPSVREPLHMIPSGQRFPEYQTSPDLAIYSGESNLLEPITFPLNQGNLMVGVTPPKPAFVQPQANPYDAYSSPSGTGSVGPLTYFKPSRTSTTLSLPPFGLQVGTPGSGEAAMSVYYQQPDTDSSPNSFDTNENPDQFFEKVFNFNTAVVTEEFRGLLLSDQRWLSVLFCGFPGFLCCQTASVFQLQMSFSIGQAMLQPTFWTISMKICITH